MKWRLRKSPSDKEKKDWLATGGVAAAAHLGTFADWCNQQQIHHHQIGQNHYHQYLSQIDNLNNGVAPLVRWQNQGEIPALLGEKLRVANKFGVIYPLDAPIAEIIHENKLLHGVQISVGAQEVSFFNCAIGSLELNSHTTIRSIRIRNCSIGTLRLYGVVRHIEIENSSITALSENDACKIHGPVRIQHTHLPTVEESLQSLRSLRGKLIQIRSLEAAGFVHAADLRISRKGQALLDRFISWLYDLGSAYGTSTLRPLLLVAIIAIANVAMVAYLDATTIGVPESELRGWYASLDGTDRSGAVLRASWLTIANIFNPLALLTGRSLVVTTDSFIGIASSALCLLGTISFALFLLAVRRRFRLDA